MSSPPSGRSTLTTSAPRSPSSIVANGPGEHAREVGDQDPVQRRHRLRTLVQRADARRLRPPPRLRPRRRPAAPARAARAAARGGARRGPARDPRRRGRAARPAKRDIAELAAPVLRELGEALGPDGELVITAGNHDHGLVAGWIDGRLETEPAGFLGLEQHIEPAEAGPLAAALAGHARARDACASSTRASGCARTSTRSTATTPTCTRPCRPSSGSRRARWRAGSCALPEDGASARRLRGGARADVRLDERAHPAQRPRVPVRRRAAPRRARGSRSPARAAGSHPVRAAALGAGYAAAIAALNAAGLGPLERSLSGAALRRGYLHGIGEVVARLGIGARARDLGPLAPLRARGRADDAAEWTSRRRRADPQHGLVGLPAPLPLASGRTTRPTGRAPPSCSTTARRRGSSGCWGSGGTRELAPPGVKQVMWHSSPAPAVSSSTPAVWCGCSTSGWQPGSAIVDRPAVDGRARRARRAPPTRRPPRRGRSRRRAGPRSGPAAARPGSSSGRTGATGSRSTPSSSWISQLGLARRRPRRSASRTARRCVSHR